MRKALGAIVLLLGIVLTPIIVHSYSISAHRFVKPSEGVPAAIVTVVPNGTFTKKEDSTIGIPPDTVNASPTSQLHGLVTQLENSPFQSAGSASFKNIAQNTSVPREHWEVLSRGNYSGSFTGASDSTLIYSNFLFSTDHSYQLKADMFVKGETSTTTHYEVCLYDNIMNDGLVYSNVLSVGQSITVTYSHLNPTHVYYLRWRPVDKNDSIDGKYIVHY